MRAGYWLVATLPLIFTQAPSSVQTLPQSDQPFHGTWHGEAGSKTIQLAIDPDGAFRWTATAGQARGEGDGRIRKEGADFLIDLPFIDSQPLQLEVTEDGKCLMLSGQNGMSIVLSKE